MNTLIEDYIKACLWEISYCLKMYGRYKKMSAYDAMATFRLVESFSYCVELLALEAIDALGNS